MSLKKIFRYPEEKKIAIVFLFFAACFIAFLCNRTLISINEIPLAQKIYRENRDNQTDSLASAATSPAFLTADELSMLFGIIPEKPSEAGKSEIIKSIQEKNAIASAAEKMARTTAGAVKNKIASSGKIIKPENSVKKTASASIKIASVAATIAPKKAVASESEKPEKKEIDLAKLGYKLKGIIHDEIGDNSTIFVYDPAKNRDVVVKYGDDSEEISILDISSREVTVSTPKGEGTLSLTDAYPVTKTSEKAEVAIVAEKRKKFTPKSTSTNENIVATPTIRVAREAINGALRGGEIETVKKDGKYTIRIMSLSPDSALAKIGFQTGDIVTALNGQSFTKPEEIPDMFEKFANSSARVNLKRGNRNIAADADSMIMEQQLSLIQANKSKAEKLANEKLITQKRNTPANMKPDTIREKLDGNNVSGREFSDPSSVPAKRPPLTSSQIPLPPQPQSNIQPESPFQPPRPAWQNTNANRKDPAKTIVGPIYHTGGSFPK
ncbi:MAG: hypothetical protein HQM10_13845 [Candidatus Riflebacteria bacterium]|nr:hypothetical protein [Candidatus Riflebacteria bacterium]